MFSRTFLAAAMVAMAGAAFAADWTTYVWTGGDVYKSVGDRLTNINGGTGALTSSFGTVVGFNTGFQLGNSPIGVQVGGSYGVYDFKGRLAIVSNANTPPVEQQLFFTAGLYKRGTMPNGGDRISLGLVYDVFHAEQWGINANLIDLGQVRGIFGFALNERTEIGAWGTLKTNDDRAAVTVAGAPGVQRTIHAMSQANFYLRQNFASGAQITGYFGVLGAKAIGDWQFGLIGQAPLNPNWSVYGNFNYVVPGVPPGPTGSGHEQFDVSFGVAYAFGGKTPKVTGRPGQPLLNVANNGSFLITD